MALAPLPQQMQCQEKVGTDGSTSGNTGSRPRELSSIALKGVFIIIFFYTLYFGRALILPFTLAFFFNFLLRPVVRALKRVRIPEAVGAALVLIVLLGSVGYGVFKLSVPAAQWMDKAPESLRQIEVKVSFLRKPIEEIDRAVEELKRITRMGSEKKPEVEIKTPGFTEAILSGTREVIVKSSVMLILLYFLLASGDLFLVKFVKLFPTLQKEKEILKITRAVEHQISRYLYTVTVINIFMGLFLGIGLYLVGMPNAALWGVMGGCLVFLPYLGPLIGISIVTVVAFLTFESLGRILLAPSIYATLEILQGQNITPMVLGSRFALNPVVIIIWLIFWGWMWGIVGALLAFPLLTVLKILCDHTKILSSVGEFLAK